MYKIIEIENLGVISKIIKVEHENSRTFIPCSPDNTDYQNFKAQINADEAQLLDADGNLMIDAKAFVATLP